jgi:hypothetical protein
MREKIVIVMTWVACGCFIVACVLSQRATRRHAAIIHGMARELATSEHIINEVCSTIGMMSKAMKSALACDIAIAGRIESMEARIKALESAPKVMPRPQWDDPMPMPFQFLPNFFETNMFFYNSVVPCTAVDMSN